MKLLTITLVFFLGIFLTGVLNEKQEEVEGLSYFSPGPKYELPASKWVPQTYNNCAPASVSMLLQHFGKNVSQAEVKKELRTNPYDSNVFSYEIVDYLKEQHGLYSKVLFNGNMDILKRLLANGFYVITEIWLHPYDDVGHNSLIRGYDDVEGVFIADDPYLGVGVKYKYSNFDFGQWKAFNREYIPVYTADREDLLKAIVGEDWDFGTMHRNSIERNMSAVNLNPQDMYAWFNLGTSYYALGLYPEAEAAFEKSRSIGWPRRMLWYQIQPVQTYNKLGKYEKALELANMGLRSNSSFAELHLEAAIAHRGLGNQTKAKEEVLKAINLYPNYRRATSFLNTME